MADAVNTGGCTLVFAHADVPGAKPRAAKASESNPPMRAGTPIRIMVFIGISPISP
jgi:hypothetical protein